MNQVIQQDTALADPRPLQSVQRRTVLDRRLVLICGWCEASLDGQVLPLELVRRPPEWLHVSHGLCDHCRDELHGNHARRFGPVKGKAAA